MHNMVPTKSALFAVTLVLTIIFLMPLLCIAEVQKSDTTTIGDILPPSIDISIERKEPGIIKFSPIVENIEIGQVYWEFGDGTSSRLRYPTHQYRTLSIPRMVTLTINNDDLLRASRFIIPSIRYEFEERFSVDIHANSIEPYFGNYIPEPYIDHIRRLSEMPSFHNLQSYLIWMSREEIISSFGSRGDMRRPNWSYIILVDPQIGRVENILGPVYNRFRYELTVTPERKFKDNEWQTEFRGLRPIWIQFK